MNPSPSTHSVGSQKPSTAASTASGKRTRTIIVARNLPDPATASTTPPVTTSSSPLQRHSSQQGSRDVKTTKLSSYAALGSEADVERYERFLAEQKAGLARASLGDSSQSQNVDGAASPGFLKGSPKRRTMGHLFPQNDGETSDSAGQRNEAAADAKQRRDAIMQHRKWLKSLPIHERLAYERQQNALKKWKDMNRQWHAFKQRTAKKLGKPETQLVMSRASEYREQMELYDALQRATPLSEKVAGDFWLVSLRNEGTRYVPVGNIFSGLYCPIRESSKLQPRVRRPLDYLDTPIGEESEGKTLTAIEKRSLEALERKKRRLKKQLAALYPHEVEPSHSGQLRVDTVDLFEWASKGRAQEESDGLSRSNPQTTSTRSLLLPLEENDQENNADAINSHRSTARSRRKGPSLCLYSEEETVEKLAETAQQQRAELAFVVDVGVVQHKTIVLENNGTTALQYQWRRADRVLNDLTRRLTLEDLSPLSEPERMTWTSISQREGMVLPNEVLEFVFSFRSQRAGVWLEQWLLDVDPLVHETEPAAIVRLQCTAIDNFVPTSQRRKVHEFVQAKESTFMAEQVLKRDIIRRVDPQYPIEFVELSDHAQRFYDAHRRGEFDSVQYSEELVRQCQALYTSAVTVITPSSEPTSPREPAGETEPTPQLTHPKEWDGTLAKLKDVASAADAQLLAQYTALKSRLVAERAGQEEDDEEEDEEDIVEKVLCTKARKKAAEDAALRALEPHFLDDFASITLAAHVTPYEPRLLSETMAFKLADMASEAAVVVEIAQLMANGTNAADLLRPLLVRALDESFVADRERERVFEDAKRHFHGTKLDEKADFRVLSQASATSTIPESLVIFLQVDVDIANWFTLIPGDSLEWKLADKLLNHESYIPPKIAAAAKSITTVLETAMASGRVPTIVLLSELSTPPMTKAMKRLEIANARAAVAAGGAADSAVSTAADIEAMRRTLATKRDKELSLRGVDIVLQRAITTRESHLPTVEFVGSLHELEVMLTPPPPRPVTPGGSGGADPEAPPPERESLDNSLRPRILLMDHFGVLAVQALKKRQEPTPTAVPATPSTPAPAADKGKPQSANDKKKLTVAPPSTPAPKIPTPRNDDQDDTIDILPGMSLEMMAAQALGQRLANLGHVVIADFFPQSWWEATFVHFAAPPTPPRQPLGGEEAMAKVPESPPPKHVLVGPHLADTFASWGSLFQPSVDRETAVPMRAIVGGRGLERKLRLIDGLLERVDTIYFVGELAATIYRVLYTKQLFKAIRRDRKPVPRFEAQRYIPVVERLMQKAYRKQVELLLPFDFIVGEAPLEDDPGAAAEDEGDDDEDEEPDEDEEEEDDEDDDDARKKKAKTKAAPQKPLEEPAGVDTWRSRPSYDGERGVVQMEAQHWIRFAEVGLNVVTNINVVDGKSSLIASADGEADEPHISLTPSTQAIPELEWMSRIFDTGPKSTQSMLENLRLLRNDHRGWVFLNGTLGVVEYRDFDAATRQLVNFLETTGTQESMLVTGKSTCKWLELIGSIPSTLTVPAVSGATAKLEAVVSYTVESKTHAMLTAFDSA